ncbi:MAG: hydrogenase/urease maturation nickel metallochaperone HypA [Candidatus Altiarchaeota archaeon]
MHGFSIAEELVRKVIGGCRDTGGRRIREIRVKCGRRVFTDASELEEAYKLVAHDTPLDGVSLSIELVDGSDCIIDRIIYE